MALDLENGYEELRQHLGHTVEVAAYGDYNDPENVAIECMDCCTVLLDFDRPREDS